mgnify:CR=1 FL=1
MYCIVGNIIGRQPHNGGNGAGYQSDISYTLTGADRHAVVAPLVILNDQGGASMSVERSNISPTLRSKHTESCCRRLLGKPEEKTVHPVKTKKKLSRADKKQIEAAIARANRTDKKEIGTGQYPL